MRAGDRFGGRFEIERLAGTGGMAEVYKARDTSTGEPVAVKVLRDDAAEQAERFVAEAKLLRELSHPAIVRFIDAGVWAGAQYMVMEWLEGIDLGERLERGPLDVYATLALAERAANALGLAHGKGIVHRDIKPSNLFLPQGDLALVKVLDFGIARRGGRRRKKLTETGSTVGTPWYMSPEQARGEREVDARADVYALGAVLYECLTGKPLVEADSVMAALAKVVLGEVPRLREYLPEAPAALEGLLARMLTKARGPRPVDCAAVAGEITAIRAAPGFYISQLPPAPSLTPAERRLLCVILTGRGAEVSRDDRPTFQTPRPEIMERLIDITHAHGGRVEALATGPMILLEGAAVATDQAARAARCALDLRQVDRDLPMALATVRGELGRTVGAEEAIDRVAQMVSRSVRPAPIRPGERSPAIRIDDVTAGLLGRRFEIGGDDHGLLLLGEREPETESFTLLGRSLTCVGRDAELATLEAFYASCEENGEAGVVVLVGAAGEGKSRLLHEFTQRLAKREVPPELWLARGDPMGAGSPFGLLAEALQRTAAVRGGETPALRQQRLRARIGRHVAPSEAQRVTEFLGELAGVPFSDTRSEQLNAARKDPQLMADQMRRAWESFIAAEASAQPVVIALEDLQWGDGSTVRLIDGALRAVRSQPWMVIATARPEVQQLFPRLWAGRNGQTIQVKELSPRAAGKLVRLALGNGVDAAVVARLVDRSEGNPLFLEELIRAESAGASGAPATVLAILQSRVEAMTLDERRCLRAASVFGQVFWRGGVSALVGDGITVSTTLESLVAREVLVRRNDARFPAQEEFAFRHALLRETAYEMLTDADRTLGHHLAAAWLESLGERDAMVLAEHHERAGAPGKAAAYYLTAANQALEGNDLDAALSRAERGQACASERPTAADLPGRLLLVQAEAHNWRSDAARAEPLARDATQALRIGTAEWFRAAGEVAVALGRLGQLDALATWVHATRYVSPLESAVGAAVTCWSRMAVHLYYAERTSVADALMETIEGHVEGRTDMDLTVTARLSGARAARALSRGDFGAVIAATAHAASVYDLAGDIRNASMQRLALGVMLTRVGAWDEAEATLEQAAGDATRLGLRYIASMTVMGTAGIRIARKQFARGAQELTAALEVMMGPAQGPSRMATLTMLAQTHLAAGNADAALDVAREAVALSKTEEKGRRRALAVLARIELSRGNAVAALDWAQQAMSAVGAVGMVDIGELLGELVYAEALEANGHHAAACDVLSVAYEQLAAQAASFHSDAHRRSYLNEIPECLRVTELARAWLGLHPT